MRIQLSLIKASPRPVRTSWDEDKMNELAESIKEQGLIVPVKVRPPDEDGFELVYGHRRVEAARRAGLEEIEAIVESIEDFPAHVQAAIENKVREDMSPLDFAKALKWQMENGHLTQAEVGAKYGITYPTVSHYLDMLKGPIGEAIAEFAHEQIPNDLYNSVFQAKAGSRTPEDAAAVLCKAASEGLNRTQVRQIAEAVAVAPTEAVKKSLLEMPYNAYIHDPEMVKQRRPDNPAYTGKRPESEGWALTPSVSRVLEMLTALGNRSRDMFKDLIPMAEVGKMSPEAKQFVAQKLRTIGRLYMEKAKEIDGGSNS